jgi:hypothetical protein
VAEVGGHVVFVHFREQCGRADASKGRRQEGFSVSRGGLLEEVNEELDVSVSSESELCDGNLADGLYWWWRFRSWKREKYAIDVVGK